MNLYDVIALISLSVVCSIAAIALVFHMGFLLRDVRDKLNKLLEHEPEPQKPGVVTPLPPDYIDVNKSSAVINPKSPAQVEREEELKIMELRK